MIKSSRRRASWWLATALVVLSSRAFQPQPLVRSRAVARGAQEEGEIFEAFEEPVAAEAAPLTSPKEDDDDENKQARVLAYMGLSLLPILALLPFLSGRDFVPADPSLYT